MFKITAALILMSENLNKWLYKKDKDFLSKSVYKSIKMKWEVNLNSHKHFSTFIFYEIINWFLIFINFKLKMNHVIVFILKWWFWKINHNSNNKTNAVIMMILKNQLMKAELIKQHQHNNVKITVMIKMICKTKWKWWF